MKDEIITFETAVLAKEKGFNEKCFRQYYDNGTIVTTSSNQEVVFGNCEELGYADEDKFSAPTQSLLQRWLREIHNIDLWFGELNPPNLYHVEDIVVNKVDRIGGVNKGE